MRVLKRGMSAIGATAVAVALTGGFAGSAFAGAGDKCCDLLEEAQRQNALLQAENDELKASLAAGTDEEPAFAIPGDLSANVAITTDYYFRGLSQTDHGPAVQGGFDWSMGLTDAIGVYIGTWASNVNYNVADQGGSVDGGVLELDVYGGLTFAATEALSFDIGALGYLYPNANEDGATPTPLPEYDYYEVYVGSSYDFGPVAADLYVNYSPDYFAESGDFIYPSLGLSVPVTDYFSLDGSVGYSFIDDNAAFGIAEDYLDYGISGSLTVEDLVTLTVGYYGTDIDDGDCYGGSDYCDGRVIFTASAAL